jgi:hypothetical protein
MFTRHEREQIRALTRAFLARFFENEITTGTDDLKVSFFWLLSFLAVPGLFMPMTMAFTWQLVALLHGPEVLRELSRGDKAFYLGFTMLATASITAIAWNSLLADRRDGLVLGVLPVRPATIVVSKLAALSLYIALVGVGMNILASLSFGLFLSSGNTAVFLLRGIAAHFVASVSASASVFLVVAAAQGLVLAACGPRTFARIAPIMQMTLVALIVVGFLLLPVIDVSVGATLAGHGQNVRPWIFAAPPLWFLGLYEVVLGTTSPLLHRLALEAGALIAASTVGVLATYPVGYRKVMTAAVQGGADAVPVPRLRRVAEIVTVSVGRASDLQAVSQFLLATVGRVERHRFIIAASVGFVVAWALPGSITVLASRPAAPRVDLLALPLAAIIFLVAGARIAMSLPSDSRAGWIFEVSPPGRRRTRAAVERMLVVFCVLPIVLLYAPLYRLLWGWHVALWHSVTCVVVGWLLVQLALWRFSSIPCASPWQPQGERLGRLWGAYAIGFVVLTIGVSSHEISVYGHTVQLIVFVACLFMLATGLRLVSLRQPTVAIDESGFAPGDVLSLN